MATKRFSGYLREPLSEYAQHDLWRFTHATTTGEVVKGSTSIFKVDETGYYDIEIQYGTVMIESKDRLSQRWINHGQYTISSTTTVTTLPALLLATTPITPELQQELEAILASAELAAGAASESKDLAKVSENNAKASENVSKQNADKTSGDRAVVEVLAQTVATQAQQVDLNAQQVSQDRQAVTDLTNQVQGNKDSVDQSVLAIEQLNQSATAAASTATEQANKAQDYAQVSSAGAYGALALNVSQARLNIRFHPIF